jgi:hypothetical protein
MSDALQMAVAFGAIVMIVKIATDTATRHKLIQKGLVDEKIKFLYNGGKYAKALSNLKWGMVLVGIGVAALAGNFAPDYFEEAGTLGLMFIFGGIGFLVYYALLAKHEKEDSTK